MINDSLEQVVAFDLQPIKWQLSNQRNKTACCWQLLCAKVMLDISVIFWDGHSCN